MFFFCCSVYLSSKGNIVRKFTICDVRAFKKESINEHSKWQKKKQNTKNYRYNITTQTY